MAVRPGRARVDGPRYARHFLASAAVAEAIVEDACVSEGELVLDLGAGRGMLTAPLARRGARVVAVELDPDSAVALRRRFGDVEVVERDLLQQPLPKVVWGARYRFFVTRHLPPQAFRPPPNADAGVLAIVRRETPLVTEGRRFRSFVAHGFRRGVRSVVSRGELRRLGLPAAPQARDLDVHQWAALYALNPRGGSARG